MGWGGEDDSEGLRFLLFEELTRDGTLFWSGDNLSRVF